MKRAALRALHGWFLLSRGVTLGVRGAVLEGPPEKSSVLLVRHTYAAGWHLPGGGVEPGQSLREALAAELAQECGVALDPAAPPRLHGVFLNTEVTRRDHVAVFVVRGASRGSWAPTREIADARSFPLHDLPEGATRGTRARLREIAAGEAPAEIW